MSESTPIILERIGELLAVEKPAGLRIHPANNDGAPDLYAWLAGREPGVIPAHRLDALTSGLVLCSANPQVRAQIGQWLSEGAIQKIYLALVFGRTRKKGIIRRPLPDARRRRPLLAITRYRTREWLGHFSLVEVRPETGRRHQIRRHLQDIGHPVIGDPRYRPRRHRSVPASPGRLWLHAWRLRLPGGEMIEAPLPDALLDHLYHLRDALMEE